MSKHIMNTLESLWNAVKVLRYRVDKLETRLQQLSSDKGAENEN